MLMLWISGDSIEKICALEGTNDVALHRVIRAAKRRQFERIVARLRGRKGKRKRLLQALKVPGAEPDEVRARLRVHHTTVWRALRELRRLPKSA
jgi:hypothetical protein